MRSVPKRLLLFALPILACFALRAQDIRTVTEPRIPPACVTLKANVAADHGVIALADERKLSTTRIQDALNQCAAAPDIQSSTPFSRSVVLRAHGKKNVFLTGPLTLRPGVVLVVSKNTALVASRDPRVFDLSAGSCGIVSEHGRGCKPFIFADGAKTPASWARDPSTRAAALRSLVRTSHGGTSRIRPKSLTSNRAFRR